MSFLKEITHLQRLSSSTEGQLSAYDLRVAAIILWPHGQGLCCDPVPPTPLLHFDSRLTGYSFYTEKSLVISSYWAQNCVVLCPPFVQSYRAKCKLKKSLENSKGERRCVTFSPALDSLSPCHRAVWAAVCCSMMRNYNMNDGRKGNQLPAESSRRG